jgi:hypothetical protein
MRSHVSMQETYGCTAHPSDMLSFKEAGLDAAAGVLIALRFKMAGNL